MDWQKKAFFSRDVPKWPFSPNLFHFQPVIILNHAEYTRQSISQSVVKRRNNHQDKECDKWNDSLSCLESKKKLILSCFNILTKPQLKHTRLLPKKNQTCLQIMKIVHFDGVSKKVSITREHAKSYYPQRKYILMLYDKCNDVCLSCNMYIYNFS